MAINFKMSDNSPVNKRRMVAASGAYNMPSVDNKSTKYATSQSVSIPITKNAQFAGSGANVIWTQPMFFSPMHTPQNWQIASKRREVYQWDRFYYANEPKVAAGVDFYSNFSMNGFKLECKNRKILKYYEETAENIELAEKYNVSMDLIYQVRKGMIWQHVRGDRQLIGHARGEKQGCAKLTWAQVREIRDDSELSQRALGKIYGVSHHAIGSIKRRKTWIEKSVSL